MTEKSPESGAITIHYMLNRGDWLAFYRHEYEVYGQRHRLWLKAKYLGFSTLVGAVFCGAVGVGAFFLVRWLGWLGPPTGPDSPQPAIIAWSAAGLVWFVVGFATIFVFPWILDGALRTSRRNQAIAQVDQGEKSGMIQTGKRYQLTVSPTELLLGGTLEIVAHGYSFVQREEFHIAWEAVYDSEIVGTRLLVRTNGLVLILPSRAFASPGDFHRLQAEIDRYRNNRLPVADGDKPAEVESPTTITQAGPIQL